VRDRYNKVMNGQHFELYFSWDVNVEEMNLSMRGYEFSWNKCWNQPETMVTQTHLGASRQSRYCIPYHQMGPSLEPCLQRETYTPHIFTEQDRADRPPNIQTLSVLAASESILTLSLWLASKSYFSPFLNPMGSA